MLSRITKGIIRIIIVIGKISWTNFFNYYQSSSNNIVWIPKKKLNYLIGDAILWDIATINALIKNKTPFKILYGKRIGKLSSKNIFHTINRGVNNFGFLNYADIYNHITTQIEKQNNKLYPNKHEVMFWENKGYMHEQFKKLDVSEPLTQLYTFEEMAYINKFDYPFLIKSEHACSANGVFKITNADSLNTLINSSSFKLENKLIIKQELINMRRDLRVILVGDEIVHYYWRINKSNEWKPTSTSFGSDVDFGNFPENWRQHILDTFKSLKLTSGAFDVTWQNDDLNTPPLYLEISPVFQPNPKLDLNGKEYAYYKKSFSPFNKYDHKFVELIFEIKLKQIKYILNNSNQ
jgi:hypothetical protein